MFKDIPIYTERNCLYLALDQKCFVTIFTFVHSSSSSCNWNPTKIVFSLSAPAPLAWPCICKHILYSLPPQSLTSALLTRQSQPVMGRYLFLNKLIMWCEGVRDGVQGQWGSLHDICTISSNHSSLIVILWGSVQSSPASYSYNDNGLF